MIRTATTLAALTSLALIVGCAGSAKQISMKGGDAELVQLAGEWVGEYSGIDSGREGKIKFDLGIGRHSAEGEVLMYQEGNLESHALQIKFVRIDDGRISGRIAPYIDPQCACEVETEFLGSISGDVIDGTFVTRIAALNLEQTGMWSVSKQN